MWATNYPKKRDIRWSTHFSSISPLLFGVKGKTPVSSSPQLRAPSRVAAEQGRGGDPAFVCLMASPASPREFTQEAARQSLIAISRSVPAAGEAVNIKSPSGAMVNGHHHDDDGAEKYRSKLISISNLSPDAQPTPCSPKDTAAA